MATLRVAFVKVEHARLSHALSEKCAFSIKSNWKATKNKLKTRKRGFYITAFILLSLVVLRVISRYAWYAILERTCAYKISCYKLWRAWWIILINGILLFPTDRCFPLSLFSFPRYFLSSHVPLSFVLSFSLVSLSFLQQERSSIILHLSSMRPGDFRDFWIEISIAADNAAVRGQLHSLMDPPHITVTYTYVSFVKSEYRQRPFYVSSYGSAAKTRDRRPLFYVSSRTCHRYSPPRPSLSSFFLLRVIRVTFNAPLYRVYTCHSKIDVRTDQKLPSARIKKDPLFWSAKDKSVQLFSWFTFNLKIDFRR